jgi:pantothenate kinase
MLVPKRGRVMTMIRGRNEDRQGPPPEVEGEIRELVRRDVAQLRKPQPEAGSEMGVSNLNSLIQRVSGTSVLEIEKLIAELQTLRDYLQNEGQRVQREITEYAQMSQAATKSTKIIAESLAQWKQTAESKRSARA